MRERNIAYIDGQNLHLGTQHAGWSVDHKKFRTYLADTYNIQEAYYYLGYLDEKQSDLYKALDRAGFSVVFKEHNKHMLGEKKGNVDTDIVFEIMHRLIEEPQSFGQIILVSGDGDYSKLVHYLEEKSRLSRILFPNGKFASSLYNSLDNSLKLSLNRLRAKIEYKKV